MDGNNALTIGRLTQRGGRPRRRSPAAPGANLWREIAIGLGVATAGIVLALCVVRASVAHARVAQPVAGYAAHAANDQAAPAPSQSPAPRS